MLVLVSDYINLKVNIAFHKNRLQSLTFGLYKINTWVQAVC